jgi:HSP20 family protein
MLLDHIDPFLAEFDRIAKHSLGAPDSVGMPMDVSRRGEEIVVRVDLPGVKADNIHLTVESRLLTISGERHTEYAEDEQPLIQERFDGTMTRRLRVPEWVDADRVSADYVDGVLTVCLPMAEQARARRITVNSSKSSSGDVTANSAKSVEA